MFNPAPPCRIIEAYLDLRTVEEFSKAMDMEQSECEKLLSGDIRIDEVIAEKLSKTFETSPLFWQNLQSQYDLGVKNGTISN